MEIEVEIKILIKSCRNDRKSFGELNLMNN